MHANPPYHDRKLDMDILLELITRKQIRPAISDFPPIKSVSVVGALLKDTGEPYKKGDMYETDMSLIVDVLAHFNDAGISLMPGAEFHIYNLLPPVESDILLAEDEDYAKTLPESDLIILNYLPRHGATPGDPDHYTGSGFTDFSGNIYQPWPSIEHKRLLSVSPLNRERGIWPRVASNLGAQFVAAAGSDWDEVTAIDFAGSDYKGIVLEEDKHKVSSSYYDLSIAAKNFNNMAGMTTPGSIIGEGLRTPREQEAYRDYAAESQQRMDDMREHLERINKAVARGASTEEIDQLLGEGPFATSSPDADTPPAVQAENLEAEETPRTKREEAPDWGIVTYRPLADEKPEKGSKFRALKARGPVARL